MSEVKFKAYSLRANAIVVQAEDFDLPASLLDEIKALPDGPYERFQASQGKTPRQEYICTPPTKTSPLQVSRYSGQGQGLRYKLTQAYASSWDGVLKQV
ncbi:hypothetical protein [Pseudomonas protegens]|uniref:hypothetical protein n=1 Tax=Pseudomonas protegens TaxID=380021 RepID=UPI00227E0DC6|nr:hypothetical protein [Pseudomonas protegens]MCY7264350.1 hypothetical protein [Pseudomonas protegens]